MEKSNENLVQKRIDTDRVVEILQALTPDPLIDRGLKKVAENPRKLAAGSMLAISLASIPAQNMSYAAAAERPKATVSMVNTSEKTEPSLIVPTESLHQALTSEIQSPEVQVLPGEGPWHVIQRVNPQLSKTEIANLIPEYREANGQDENSVQHPGQLVRVGFIPQPNQTSIEETAPASVEEVIEHVAQPGDTLWALGRRYNVPWEKLQTDSNISNPKTMPVGQIVTVRKQVPAPTLPSPAATEVAATPETPLPAGVVVLGEGELLYTKAKEADVPLGKVFIDNSLAINGSPESVPAGTRLIMTNEECATDEVRLQPGESLEIMGISEKEFERDNPEKDASDISKLEGLCADIPQSKFYEDYPKARQANVEIAEQSAEDYEDRLIAESIRLAQKLEINKKRDEAEAAAKLAVEQAQAAAAAEARLIPTQREALAKMLLPENNPNITYDNSPNDRVQRSIRDITDDGSTFLYDVDQDNKNEIPISPAVLQILVKLSGQFPLQINSLTTSRLHNPNGDHPKGEAVDIAFSEEIYRYLYEHRAELKIDQLIYISPPEGTTTLRDGEPGDFDSATKKAHDYIHFSVKGQVEIDQPQPAPAVEVAPEAPANQSALSTQNQGKLGVDYSWAEIENEDLAAKGYSFVFRYISRDPSKNINIEERDIVQSKGIDIGLVWQTSASRALDGHAAGIEDAIEAQRQSADLGVPPEVAIYFAVDFDAQAHQMPAIADYFAGVATVLDKNRMGIYGGFDMIQFAVDNGLTKYFWQTGAWSEGHVHPAVHVYQNTNQDYNGGADIIEALQPDIGTWADPAELEARAPAPALAAAPSEAAPAPASPEVAAPPFNADNTNVLSKSGLTADDYNKIMADSGMKGLGNVIADIENKYGINGLFVISHGFNESARGTSQIARAKNNLFGIGAYDTCPEDCAESNNSYAASVYSYAELLHNEYLNPEGDFFSGGTTIRNIFVHYSKTDQSEIIAQIMNEELAKVRS